MKTNRVSKMLLPVTGFWFLVSGFFSCDKVDYPFEKKEIIAPVGIVYDTTYSVPNSAKRVVLIEEFTGNSCTNCPDGHREVERLDSIHGTQLIPVSIHAGYFAKPHVPPDTAYLTDFRSTDGDTYYTDFAVWGNPSALVSRKNVGGDIVLQKSLWESTINATVGDVPKAKIDIMNLYNDSLKLIKGKVSIQWLAATTGSYKLQIFLTEDHIIDWQLDGTYNNPNYDHRHVLRKAINGTWGTQITSSNANDTASFEYSLTLNTQWKSVNCQVVAFIYNSSGYEVIQANETKVK